MRGVYFRLWAPSSLLLRRNFETGIGRMADWSFAINCDQRLIHQTATPDRGVPLARMARGTNYCCSRCGLDSSMTKVACLSPETQQIGLNENVEAGDVKSGQPSPLIQPRG